VNADSPEHLARGTRELHRKHFGAEPAFIAYCPGRVEVLGNHTDYNEGFVLSAAIDRGICFTLSPSEGDRYDLIAADLSSATTLDARDTLPGTAPAWARYAACAAQEVARRAGRKRGFNAVIHGNLPIAAGLSSSAALEVAAANAVAAFLDVEIPPLDLARLCQHAETGATGVRCGLLDQISVLFAEEHRLVFTDFRTLKTEMLPLPEELCFLICDTGVKHTLAESAYNLRRSECEQATAWFRSVLDHPVQALRDVSPAECEDCSPRMNPAIAKRALHVVTENDRVSRASALLRDGRIEEFGRLMFESHQSSIRNFENSSAELDFLVDLAGRTPGVYGARLSGGGFGGSAILLTKAVKAETVAYLLARDYTQRFRRPLSLHRSVPSAGARLIAL